MKNKYSLGESIEIRIRNNGGVSYVYNPTYAACYNLKFFDASVEPRRSPSVLGEGMERRLLPLGLFIVPEGTHCDLVFRAVIKHGEEKVLLTWGAKECVKDNWGCVESVPVKSGKYKVVGEFYEAAQQDGTEVEYMTKTGNKVMTEWSFIVE